MKTMNTLKIGIADYDEMKARTAGAERALSGLLGAILVGTAAVVGAVLGWKIGAPNDDRERAAQAARRMEERRQRLEHATLAELIDSIHEGHRF